MSHMETLGDIRRRVLDKNLLPVPQFIRPVLCLAGSCRVCEVMNLGKN